MSASAVLGSLETWVLTGATHAVRPEYVPVEEKQQLRLRG